MVERLLQLDIHVRNWLSPLLGLNREKIANFIPTADILIACANLCASDVYRAIDKICSDPKLLNKYPYLTWHNTLQCYSSLHCLSSRAVC